MYNSNKTKRKQKRAIYTVFVVAALLLVFTFMVRYAYSTAKEDGFENLHMQTKEIKEDIELQVHSDLENLQTMANFAAKLHVDGDGYDVLINSFKSIGLIENVGILLPDNTFVTKQGEVKISNELISFKKESLRSKYVSGVVPDFTFPDRKVVRSSVAIKDGENVVGILYGVTGIDTLEKRFMENASVENSQLFIVDRSNGDFIANTVSDTVGNFSALKTRKFIGGYSYEELKERVFSGLNGYSAFQSRVMEGTTFYLHYAPLNVSQWHIMVAEPEDSVFAKAKTTERNMAIAILVIVLIMSLYLALIFASERQENRVHRSASKIRKLLLEINQQSESINEALENIVEFASARSAFFVDTDGEDYGYVANKAKAFIPGGETRAYFISKLINFSGRITKERGTSVSVIRVFADSVLAANEPDFYNFMKQYSIRSIIFSGITDKKNHLSVLGIVNPGKYSGVQLLLEDISICFSMAIHNKKYLNKTEIIAATDSLTGLSNRMAYKKDIKVFDEKHSKDFFCVYIDVNELHVINNKYGHAAGDGMLLFVANTLKEVFAYGKIYRIGGDEFLVFAENKTNDVIEDSINLLKLRVEEMNYHIAVGVAECERNTDTESLVFAAEKHMYEEKAKYYQKKEKRALSEIGNQDIVRISTGIREFDTLLSILSQRYHGVYCVSLDTGMARRILMPSYLSKFSEETTPFAEAFTYYVREMVHSDYQRAMLSFFNYDAIRKQLSEGITPVIEYLKVNGERVLLSVYALPKAENDMYDTIWVYESLNSGKSM